MTTQAIALERRKNLFKTDDIIRGIGNLILAATVLMVIVPLIYILLCSIMEPSVRSSVGVSLDINDWTLEGYRRVFQDENIWIGFFNSFLYSTLFMIVSVVVTMLGAYPLSRSDFQGRKIFYGFFIFTMFFGGGLMPTFLLVDQLHLLNTIWAIILPGAVNVWDMILAISYYKSMPTELREASQMDGATDVQFFVQVLFPLCKPIIAVICLYQFVATWNSYFDAMIYLDERGMQPLQLVIRAILVQNQINPALVANMEKIAETAKLADLLKYSTIVISSVPLIIMYPFFSKYFEKGILIGSVKG